MKTKTKILNNDHPVIGTLLIALILVIMLPVTNFPKVNEVKAESACPAPIPTSSMTIRSGGPSGPILGSYTNEGYGYDWDGNPVGNPNTSDEIFVPSGTVIWYTASTSGVEATNRTPGSTQSYSGPITVLSPSGKAGYYPSGYSFTKQSFITSQSDALTSGQKLISVGGTNSCWDGFEDGSTRISIRVTVGSSGGGPSSGPIEQVREATNNLAIVKNPSVSLLANGAATANITSGSTANFSWTTDSVNIGNSCQATNNNSDSTWTGPKLGQASYTPPASPPPSGGSQTVGPFPATGTYSYSIFCYGLNGVVSSTSSVTVNVGNPPTYTCAASPETQQVLAGSNGSVTIAVTPLNGYNSPVTFSLASMNPSGQGAPTVNVDSTPQNSPYTTHTPVVISTTASTNPGSYSLVFTGTNGVSCPAVTFEVILPVPTGEIRCDAQLGSCTKAVAQSAQITWSSAYVDSCQVSHNPPAVDWTGLSGSQNTGALSSNRTYYLNCSGPYGSIARSVDVNVIGAIDAPAWAVGDNSICQQITVTWGAPSSGSSPSYYRVYRRNQGDSGNGTVLHNTSNNSQFSYIDATTTVGPFYEYGVSAIYVSTESNITWATPLSSLACTASLDGSYKKIVGVGSSIPNIEGTYGWCSGPNNGYTLPSGQVYQSGNTVYFEICINASASTVTLTNVRVSEILAEVKYLDNIQFVDAGGSTPCASDSGGGVYTIGTLEPDQACGIMIRATVATPSGTSGILRSFVNSANLLADQVSAKVTVNRPFVIGSGEPTRNETPR